MRSFVELEDVDFAYGAVPVLERINLTVEPGDFLGIIGPNATDTIGLASAPAEAEMPCRGKRIMIASARGGASRARMLLLALFLPGSAAGCATVLTPAPATVNFGSVYVGIPSAPSAPVKWKSSAAATLSIEAIDTDPKPPFSLAAPFTSLNLPTGVETPAYTFRFTPQTVGAANGTAVPLSTSITFPDTAQPVALAGTGAAQLSGGSLAVTGGNLTAGQVLDFGAVTTPGGAPAVRTFTITNNGPTAITVNAARWSVDGLGFSATAPTGPFLVPAGQSVNVTLEFVPSAVGDFADAVTFVDAANPANHAGTAVKGKGVAPGG